MPFLHSTGVWLFELFIFTEVQQMGFFTVKKLLWGIVSEYSDSCFNLTSDQNNKAGEEQGFDRQKAPYTATLGGASHLKVGGG